jgi:hypothetical protein
MHVLWFLGSVLTVFVGVCVEVTVMKAYPHPADQPWFAQVALLAGMAIMFAGIGSAIISIVQEFEE